MQIHTLLPYTQPHLRSNTLQHCTTAHDVHSIRPLLHSNKRTHRRAHTQQPCTPRSSHTETPRPPLLEIQPAVLFPPLPSEQDQSTGLERTEIAASEQQQQGKSDPVLSEAQLPQKAKRGRPKGSGKGKTKRAAGGDTNEGSSSDQGSGHESLAVTKQRGGAHRSGAVRFPAVRVLSNAAEGVLEVLQESESDPFQSFEELQGFLGLQASTVIDHLLELCSHGYLDKQSVLRLCGLVSEDHGPDLHDDTNQPHTSSLSYAHVRAALEGAGKGAGKKRERAFAALCAQHGEAVTALGEERVQTQVALVHKLMLMEEQQQQEEQIQRSYGLGEGAPFQSTYTVTLPRIMGQRVSAYLQGLSVEELRHFPPDRKKPLAVGTVEESLLRAIKSGVELPIDRLQQDFKLLGGPHSLSLSEVWSAVQHFTDESGVMNGFEGYNAVRDVLLSRDLHDKVYKQEEQHGGEHVTLQQVRLVCYLCKLRRAQQMRHVVPTTSSFVGSDDALSSTEDGVGVEHPSLLNPAVQLPN